MKKPRLARIVPVLLLLGVGSRLLADPADPAEPASGVEAAVHPVIGAHAIEDVKASATLKLGATADWVAITPDAVWVGSTGPFAIHRIDPKTNRVTATVPVPGEPCAGIATGFGSLWVPLCGDAPGLARIDIRKAELTAVFDSGPAAPEGGIATSPDSVWLVIDAHGSVARIDPDTGAVRDTILIPPGSYNPLYSDGMIWVTQAEGAAVTRIDATSGEMLGTIKTGPGPRFLAGGGGAVYTLNQGDGTVTRIDAKTATAASPIALGVPGHGGDIAVDAGLVWVTMMQVPLSALDAATGRVRCQWTGGGGDSLGVGHGAVWLTDYHGGTVSRLPLRSLLANCAVPTTH